MSNVLLTRFSISALGDGGVKENDAGCYRNAGDGSEELREEILARCPFPRASGVTVR